MLVKERQRRIEAGDVEGEEDVRSEGSDGEEEEQDEEFFTEGTDELLEARRDIAWYSLARAKKRIHRQRWEAKVPLEELVGLRNRTYEPFKVRHKPLVALASIHSLLAYLCSTAALYLARLSTSLGPSNLTGPIFPVHRLFTRNSLLVRSTQALVSPFLLPSSTPRLSGWPHGQDWWACMASSSHSGTERCKCESGYGWGRGERLSLVTRQRHARCHAQRP